MNRAAIAIALMTAATAAIAQSPPSEQVPPPPQTQGELNSQAAKHPTQPQAMRPLSAAAHATPRKHVPKANQQATKAKPKAPQGEEKPKAAE